MIGLALLFASLATGIVPAEQVARESVDLIELNHFYDEHARLVFDQVIFFDWSEGKSRYHVRAWRLVKNPAQLPERDWRGGGYTATWQDGEQLRVIWSAAFRETWTQYDPELVEREYLPKERRKELRSIRVDKPSGAIRPKTADRELLPVESRRKLRGEK